MVLEWEDGLMINDWGLTIYRSREMEDQCPFNSSADINITTGGVTLRGVILQKAFEKRIADKIGLISFI